MLSTLRKLLNSTNPRLKFFSTHKTTQNIETLQFLFSEAESKLKSPDTIKSSVDTFTKASKLASQLYISDPLQQSHWYLRAAYNLAQQNLLKQSLDFFTEGSNILSQHKPSIKSQNLINAYILAGETSLLHKNFILSEKYFSQTLGCTLLLQPEMKVLVLEKMIAVKFYLKKDKEAAELCEEVLTLFKSVKNMDLVHAQILLTYGKHVFHLNDTEKSLKLFKKALVLLGKIKHSESATLHKTAYEYIIDAYVKDDNSEEALNSVINCAKLLEKDSGPEQLLSFYWKMHQNLEAFGNFEQIIKKIVEISEGIPVDIERLSKAYEVAFEFYLSKGRLQESFDSSEKLLNAAKNSKNQKIIVKALANISQVYVNLDPDKAKRYIDKAQSLINSFGVQGSEQKLIDNLYFQYYSSNNDYKNSDYYLSLCIAHITEKKQTALELIILHIQHSLLHSTNNSPQKSLSSLFTALQISDRNFSVQDFRSIEILSAIGKQYKDIKDYENAVKYAFKALESVKMYHSDKEGHFLFIYKNIIEIFEDMGNNSLVLEIGEKAIKVIELNENLDEVIAGKIHLAVAKEYNKSGEKRKALEGFFKAKERFGRSGNVEELKIVEGCIKMINEEVRE